MSRREDSRRYRDGDHVRNDTEGTSIYPMLRTRRHRALVPTDNQRRRHEGGHRHEEHAYRCHLHRPADRRRRSRDHLRRAGRRRQRPSNPYGSIIPDTKRVTPDLSPTKMKFDRGLASEHDWTRPRRIRDGTLPGEEQAGPRQRGNAIIPRYRVDIIHPVDLAEEVAIGYGLDKIEPLYPPSKEPGSLNRLNVVWTASRSRYRWRASSRR